MEERRVWRARAWRCERGSQALQAAAVALAAAVLVAALLGSADVLGPAVERAYQCAAAVLSGGGACPAASGPSAGGQEAGGDRPWWQRLWDGITGAWDWLVGNVLAPIGNFLAGAWDWLVREREWAWLRDMFDRLRGLGWLGNILAEGLGFLMDLLVGIGADGKFSIGGVLFSLGTTILSFFGVGLLAKIPVLGKLFKGGGLLARLWGKFAGTGFGKWLIRFGTEGIADVLQGKWGTILQELGERIPWLTRKLPWLAPLLRKINPTDIRILKTVGNYLWRIATEGPIGLVKDVIKTVAKDVIKNPVMRELFKWKGLRDIIEWLQAPKPW